MPKKKLLVIMGAGSSIPVGKPSVDDIDELMLSWSKEWKPPNGSRLTNPYKELWNLSKDYFKKGGEYDLYKGKIYPNFESALGEMVRMADWVLPPTIGNPIIEIIADKQHDNCFGNLLNLSDEERVKERKSILEQYEFLIKKLAKHMRNSCSNVDLDSCCNFKLYEDFFKILKEKFDLGIYTLNYDNVAIKALPDAFTGFADQFFDQNTIFNRKEWGFIYHLHGSVHLTIYNDKHITWEPDLGKEFKVYDGEHFQLVNDDVRLPWTTLLAGGFKLGQLLPEPYQTIYASLVRHVHEADALLIIGYGFGDSHVNWAIKNRYRSRKFQKVFIIDKKNDAILEQGDFWVECLRYSFANYPCLSTEKIGELTVKRFCKEEELFYLKSRIAICLEGTDKAFIFPNDVADWLNV